MRAKRGKRRPARAEVKKRRSAKPRGSTSEIDPRIIEGQVHICKAFANHTRLRMLWLLGQQEYGVGELSAALGVSQANLSQHLAILKSVGIVGVRRNGRAIHCFLTTPAVTQACHLIQDVLRAQLEERQTLKF